jgi:DNA-binding NarL/FixJ family response regulator
LEKQPEEEPGMEKTKILIVDDQTNVRQSLGTILGLIDDFEVVGKAADGEDAIRLTVQLAPDVVLMLTMHGSANARQRAFEAGVDGFVEKGIAMEDLADSIRRVHRAKEMMK